MILLYSATSQGKASCGKAHVSQMMEYLEVFVFTVNLGRTEFTVANKSNTLEVMRLSL